MAMTGTMIFSHIIPVLLGFSGVFLISTGIMDDKKELLVIGIILFITACVSPFIILRTIV
ncbi:hypothetical protein [Methanobrevibacter sp. DSM 116169]|uniref:hypothetical protein n=1 Tax=Methanobrevibacter sp. DSM 116169 TaxID=3242727 RepID=UPI0038FD22A9